MKTVHLGLAVWESWHSGFYAMDDNGEAFRIAAHFIITDNFGEFTVNPKF